jgi:hypothetical protein
VPPWRRRQLVVRLRLGSLLTERRFTGRLAEPRLVGSVAGRLTKWLTWQLAVRLAWWLAKRHAGTWLG